MLENTFASFVVMLHRGEKTCFIGSIHPSNSIIQPKYIINSVKIENINVENRENKEIPPKETVLIKSVKLTAKTVQRSEALTYISNLGVESLVLVSRKYSLKTKIPRVANAESQSAVS